MEALFFYSALFLLSFFPLAGVLAAGCGLEVLLRGVFQQIVEPELKWARVVALGLVWTLVCFGVALLLFYAGLKPSWLWSFIYLLSSVGLAFLAWRVARAAWMQAFDAKAIFFFFAVAGVAILIQIPSLLWVPSIMDTPQLGWTNRFTDPLSIEYGEMNGAVGYSGLIFFTGLLAPHLPLAVCAASTKIILYFLTTLLAVYIARVFYSPNFRLGVILVTIILAGSSFGVIILTIGKDSLLGVVLSMFFISSFVDKSLTDKFRSSALFCGVAACMGVISVPFMAVAGGLAFLLESDFRAKLQMAASHLLIAGPLAAFPAQAMAKVPFWYVAIGLPIFGLLLTGLAKFRFWDQIKIPKFPFWLIWVIILISYAVGFKILPYRLDFENFTSPFLPPLDGKTGFLALIYSYNCSSGLVTGFFLLGPFVSLWLLRKANPLKWVPFAFLPATLALFLWMCSSPLKLIDGPSQWTLIKNCIHYFLPIVASMAMGPAIAQIPRERGSFKGWLWLLGLLFSASFIESLSKFQTKTGVLYTPKRYGFIQSSEPDMARVADYLWNQNAKSRLLVESSSGFNPIGDFSYFSPRTDFQFWHKDKFHAVADIEMIVNFVSEKKNWHSENEVFVIITPPAFEKLKTFNKIKVERIFSLYGGRSFLCRIVATN